MKDKSENKRGRPDRKEDRRKHIRLSPCADCYAKETCTREHDCTDYKEWRRGYMAEARERHSS